MSIKTPDTDLPVEGGPTSSAGLKPLGTGMSHCESKMASLAPESSRSGSSSVSSNNDDNDDIDDSDVGIMSDMR